MSNDKKTPVTQTEDIDNKIAKAVGDAIKEALPLAVMAAAQARPAQQVAAKPTAHLGERCHVCGQYVVACKNEHVLMYVGPQNRRRLKDWPGIFLNGVHYSAAAFNHKIYVPKENNFRTFIQSWEGGEEDLATGRVVDHDSGVLSGKPGKSRINNANPYGFGGLMPGNPQ